MAQRFVLNETSYHGKGAINEIANEITARGFKKAFVCSDPDLIKFNVTSKVLAVLDKAGISYEVYSNIKPNPTIQNVQTGVETFKLAARPPSNNGNIVPKRERTQKPTNGASIL